MESITISQKRYEELLHTESVHQLLKTFLAKKAKDYSPMPYKEVQMLSELLNVGDSE